jgi:hypothetical protein
METTELAKIKWNDLESLSLNDKGKLALRNQLLNRNPPKEWIKKHPLYKNDYLPIDKVEYLLTAFFGRWHVEIKSAFQIANSVCVTVRLHYLNSDTGQFDWQDGAGAAPMQLDAGAKAADFSAVKNNAVMLALPIAETNAEKDAADKIGKLFGRDLNRKNTLGYEKMIEGMDFKDAKFTEK